MSNLDSFDVVISRTELGLSDMSLNTSPYVVSKEGVRPGDTAWRRDRVKSPYVHGEVMINAVREQAEAQIGVEVIEDTYSAIQSSIRTLVEAFSQTEYTLDIQMSTTSYKWQCNAADYSISWVSERWHALRVGVAFSMPRYPVEEATEEIL